MSHVITPASKSGPVPTHADGSPYEWAMRYADDTRMCYADDLSALIAVLLGIRDYDTLSEQDALVERIRGAVRKQCSIQALVIDQARRSGAWDKCTPVEQAVLLSSRHEQPIGWSRDLLGEDYWSAPCPLLVLTTGYGYGGREFPVGEPERLWWIDPIDDESLIFSLDEIGSIHVFQHSGT